MYILQIVFNWSIYFCAASGLISNRFNFLLVLISLELLLLSLNLNFIVGSIYLNDLYGQIFSLFIITIAGIESAIGLSILVTYLNSRGNIDISKKMNLKN